MLSEYGLFCVVLKQHERTSTYAVVSIRDHVATLGFIVFKKQKIVNSSSSWAHEARVGVATRSACRSNSTLEPFVQNTRFCRVFHGPHLEIRII